MQILIMRIDAIGDVVLSLPAINAIRKHWPKATITLLVGEAASEIVLGNKAIDHVIVYPQRLLKIKTSLRQRFFVLAQLTCSKYDLIIDFHALFRSHALIAWSRDKGGIGYQHNNTFSLRKGLLNTCIPFIDINEHAVNKTLIFLKSMGVQLNRISFHLGIKAEHRAIAAAILSNEGVNDRRPVVAISPVASWQTKCWGRDRFAQVADTLICRYGAAIVFTGSSKEADDIVAITDMMNGKGINLAGQTPLLVLAALIERVDVLVCGDTGPGHIGGALGTPVISIFGPTAPWRFRPFGRNHQVLWAGLACSPCFKHDYTECASRQCMQAISVHQVLEHVEHIFTEWPVGKDQVDGLAKQ